MSIHIPRLRISKLLKSKQKQTLQVNIYNYELTSSMTLPSRSSARPYSTKWLLGLQGTSPFLFAGRKTRLATSTAIGPDNRTIPTAAGPPPNDVTIAAIVPDPSTVPEVPALSSFVKIKFFPEQTEVIKRKKIKTLKLGLKFKRETKVPVEEKREIRVRERGIRDLGLKKFGNLWNLGFRRRRRWWRWRPRSARRAIVQWPSAPRGDDHIFMDSLPRDTHLWLCDSC